ncbi:MAG TPA: DUF4349 domain-containing protein [bacterium]|nr:DUF4349 domain-containing protein [bacterium]
MNMIRYAVVLAVLCPVLLCTCSKKDSFAPPLDRAMIAEKEESAGARKSIGGQTVASDVQERRLIKTGTVTFRTDSVSATGRQVRDMLKTHNGYVAQEDEYGHGGSKSFTIIARIPAASFDRFVEELEKALGPFDARSIGVQDVTAEFVDTEARLKAKKEVEKNYLDILSRAKTIEETLAVQKLLGEVRGEIESVEGRLKLLQDQTAYSSLTISFYERSVTGFSFLGDVKDAFKAGWTGFLQVLVGIAYAWVFIIIGVGIVVYRKVRRKKG